MPSHPKVATPLAEPDSAPAWTSESSPPQLTPWAKPVLSVYGDVRQLTMGVSPGIGESGHEGTRHN